MPTPPLSFFARLWFAWSAHLRILFDGAFAARLWDAREATPALPTAPTEAKAKPESVPPARMAKVNDKAPPDTSSALQLLALLQRDGRFVDFVQQDIATFSDADVGTAARVVHDGCKKVLDGHMKIAAIRSEEEDSTVTVDAGFDAAAIKLSGNVKGAAPFTGKLRHKGWRARDVKLPTAVEGHDSSVLAPAEVEL